jgi:hypothetical protein
MRYLVMLQFIRLMIAKVRFNFRANTQEINSTENLKNGTVQLILILKNWIHHPLSLCLIWNLQKLVIPCMMEHYLNPIGLILKITLKLNLYHQNFLKMQGDHF